MSGMNIHEISATPNDPYADRVQHVFTVPAVLHGVTKVRTIHMIELNANEELMASKRAMNDQGKLMYELSKKAVVRADGKPLSDGDGTVDTWYDNLHPQIRTLVVSAYNSLHSVPKDTLDAFLNSRQARV